MTDLLISTDELAAMGGRPDVRVVDVRFALDEPLAGERAYGEGHIPGAVYLDWHRDLSDPEDPVEGQLAPPARFQEAMQRAGIGDDTLVVAYDDNMIFLAARLCWALQVYGHDRVRWLDGGYPKWVGEGRPVTREVPALAPASFHHRPRPGLRRTKADVLAIVREGGAPLFDCRMDSTYEAAGARIPGARRFPAPSLLAEDGTLLPPAQVARMAEAAGIPRDEPSILYCGGGVSASAAHAALRAAGYDLTSVYDGSWSEWSADPDTPKERHGA